MQRFTVLAGAVQGPAQHTMVLPRASKMGQRLVEVGPVAAPTMMDSYGLDRTERSCTPDTGGVRDQKIRAMSARPPSARGRPRSAG
ncbi:hypothetical protein ACRAWF_31980 [Streptomyces sp. L7]